MIPSSVNAMQLEPTPAPNQQSLGNIPEETNSHNNSHGNATKNITVNDG
jgi:hypothetical protein